MTTKESIRIITNISETFPLEESEWNALRFAIKQLQRFEGAMLIMWPSNALPNNVKNFNLYAIPKEQTDE